MTSLAPLFPLFHHKHQATPAPHVAASTQHVAVTQTSAPMRRPAAIHRHPLAKTQTHKMAPMTMVPVTPAHVQPPETASWRSFGVQTAAFVAVALAATLAYIQWRRKHQVTLAIEAARWGPLVTDAYNTTRSDGQNVEALRLVVMAVDRLNGATVLLTIILIALAAIIVLTAIFQALW